MKLCNEYKEACGPLKFFYRPIVEKRWSRGLDKVSKNNLKYYDGKLICRVRKGTAHRVTSHGVSLGKTEIKDNP